MEYLLRKILEEMIFWMAWIIIPLIMEILPAMGGFLILLKKRITKKPASKPLRYPDYPGL